MTLKAFISGCAGTELSAEEHDFFAEHRPCGLILFQRNCAKPDQLKALISSVRDAVSSDLFFVLIDQEGGRVARMKPPHWREFPAAGRLGKYYKQNPENGLETIKSVAFSLASEIREMGINVNCVPILDIPVPGSHDIIGDRAYGNNAEDVMTISKAVIAGHLEAGVLPVIKHIPGHGRAQADSHEALPVITTELETLRKTDFVPFKALNHCPLGMTGHLLLNCLDAENPVSTSKRIISEIIRGEIGFQGALMTDDLSMKALSGSMQERSAKAIEAGCDLLLHCNGHFDEMLDVANSAPRLQGESLNRITAAYQQLQPPKLAENQQIHVLIEEILAKTT